jgi:four helix bundle protein
MQDYKKLVVWERAHSLTLDVYRVTRVSGRRGNSALVSQMQRAAVSIGANIVEGCGRGGHHDLARFLQIAAASAHELEYHLLLARELEVIPVQEALRLEGHATSVKRMLSSLIRRVKERAARPAGEHREERSTTPHTDDCPPMTAN